MSLPEFEEILEDPRATPSEVVRVAADHLRDLFSAKLSAKRAFLADDLTRLVRSRGAFGGVINLANGVSLALEQEELDQAGAWVEGFAADLERSRDAFARLGPALVPPGARVLTLSRSTTVLRLLEGALIAGARPRVIAGAGLPLGEGRVMAGRLARAGMRVELVVDAALPARLAGIDLVLVGGAALSHQGLLARAGTMAVLREARRAKVLAFAVMGSEALVAGPLAGELRPESCPTVPLWPQAPAGVTVRNAPLEWCPVDLLSGVLAEAGAVDARRLLAGSAVVPRAESFPVVRETDA